MPADDFIPGIYNYCDRWCERCPLTARCGVYAREQEALSDNPDIADPEKEAYWEYISANFAEAMRMLQHAAEEFGIDLEALPDESDYLEEERRRIEGMEFVATARAYNTAGRAWLEAHREGVLHAAARKVELALSGAEEEFAVLEDAFSIVSWYLFQIEIKLQRAQHSREQQALFDEDQAFEEEQANAAAKIALIGIERSLGAWNLLYQHLPEHQNQLIDLMATLERTRKLTVQHFPGAPGFRRPGFDD